MQITVVNWMCFAVVKTPPPKSASLVLIRRILGYELQLRSRVGLDGKTLRAIRRVQKQLGSCAVTPLKSARPELTTGSQLMREWNGVTHKVVVTDHGFDWHGRHYRSLSAIAKAITGAHWSGPRFFGLRDGERKPAIAKSATP